MTVKPLAEVSHGRLCVGAAAFAPGSIDRSELEWQAKHINEAHWQALQPFRSALARAHNALLDVATVFENSHRAVSKGAAPYDATFLEGLIWPIVDEAARAINETQPGDWVPKAQFDEALAVLSDLRQERHDEYRLRVQRALKMLNEGMPAGNQVVRDVLEGRWLAGSL